MIYIDLKSKTPIYEQIYEQIKSLILREILLEDEKLPSVRELASNLTINPNTIQKAYGKLEQDGYIYVIRGRGNFVNHIGKVLLNEERDDVTKRLEALTREAMHLGMTVAELRSIIDAFGKEVADDKD